MLQEGNIWCYEGLQGEYLQQQSNIQHNMFCFPGAVLGALFRAHNTLRSRDHCWPHFAGDELKAQGVHLSDVVCLENDGVEIWSQEVWLSFWESNQAV